MEPKVYEIPYPPDPWHYRYLFRWYRLRYRIRHAWWSMLEGFSPDYSDYPEWVAACNRIAHRNRFDQTVYECVLYGWIIQQLVGWWWTR